MSVEGTATTQEVLKGKVVKIPQTDETLTKAGYSADAKVVGDMFKALEGNVVNKPFGNYTGNGSEGSRVIDTKGIGRLALVYHGDHLSFVTPKGALKVTLADGTLEWVSTVVFGEGKFTISTESDAYNKADETYYYQVI